MPNLRDLLNEIKWTKNLAHIEIWILHRGAPRNTKIISGAEIHALEKSFFKTSTATIPYHRILKIVYNGTVLFERN